LRTQAASVLALTLAVACSDAAKPSAPPKADEFFYDCGESTLTNNATDESFVEFINKEVALGLQVDDGQAPILDTPAPGSTISASIPPEFWFRVGPEARHGGPASRVHAAAKPLEHWAIELLGRLILEGVAHAHCAPVSGDNYLFRLSDERSATPFYTAQLSVTRFTPGLAAWSRALRGREGRVVRLSLARAIYSAGAITNGPFIASAPVEFAVGP
jgi:hypothetical protein